MFYCCDAEQCCDHYFIGPATSLEREGWITNGHEGKVRKLLCFFSGCLLHCKSAISN
ncbi:unnamed protein product [Ixodes persulcatus]